MCLVLSLLCRLVVQLVAFLEKEPLKLIKYSCPLDCLDLTLLVSVTKHSPHYIHLLEVDEAQRLNHTCPHRKSSLV